MPPSLRFVARRLFYLPVDTWECLTGRRDKLTPPRGKIFVGSGDFAKAGQNLLDQIIETCNPSPASRVLDIGCGIGRLAVPLTRFLSTEGSYEGFDIVKMGIDWCQKHITKSFPNFHFTHIDLKNDLYNLSTAEEAKRFVFPYNDNEFDLIILTSVFTHMLPDDVDNYLGQIRRVLKDSGKCFATFFVLNERALKIASQRKDFNFPVNMGNYSLFDKQVKEANVAYDENYLTNDLLGRNGLQAEKIHYGWWPQGRPDATSFGFQDSVVLVKDNPARNRKETP